MLITFHQQCGCLNDRLSGRDGAVVRACASDSVVRCCEFESRHCHLTGHIADQLMLGPLMSPWVMP